MATTARGQRNDVPQETTEPKEPAAKTPDSETTNVRTHIAIMMVSLLIVLALVAAVQTGALSVLQLILPLIGAIIGFYFGRATKT